MAQKRMFSKQIVQTDAFLDMPQSCQNLYFHLAMEADDDGFVGNPKRIMKMVGSAEDDYKILIAKRFVLKFEDGVCVIKHWFIHNYIQGDRYVETRYREQKGRLFLKDNKAYTEIENAPKELKGKKVDIEIDIPEWLDAEVWDSWVEYRKKIKKPLTKKGLELNIKFLDKHKEDAQEIIEKSISNGWTGLFELKNNSRENKSGGLKL